MVFLKIGLKLLGFTQYYGNCLILQRVLSEIGRHVRIFVWQKYRKCSRLKSIQLEYPIFCLIHVLSQITLSFKTPPLYGNHQILKS